MQRVIRFWQCGKGPGIGGLDICNVDYIRRRSFVINIVELWRFLTKRIEMIVAPSNGRSNAGSANMPAPPI